MGNHTSGAPYEAQVKNVLTRLGTAYPKATIALENWKTPWELLVAVVLSAQCTDIRVNIVTKTLFRKYPTFHSYLSARVSEFEQEIRSTGFYRNKAKHILQAAKVIHEKFDDRVPERMTELLTVPGVARKTANVVLGNAYGVVEGIAVDTHVLRLSQRLRLVDISTIGGKKRMTFSKNGREALEYYKDANPVKIEFQLMDVVPRALWLACTYRLIDHGRSVCTAKKPKCAQCVLSDICPSSRV